MVDKVQKRSDPTLQMEQKTYLKFKNGKIFKLMTDGHVIRTSNLIAFIVTPYVCSSSPRNIFSRIPLLLLYLASYIALSSKPIFA